MHSVNVQKRRKRSINFTESDRQILLNLVEPHLGVIENKKLDKLTSKLKSETWEKIKTQYNQLNTEPRTAHQLKLFFEANKYRMRKVNKGFESNVTDVSESKIVKIEVETKTIMDALAQSKQLKTDFSPGSKSPQAKIKCVKIETLQGTKLSENLSPKISITPAEMEPASSCATMQHSIPSQFSLTKQDNLHAIRLQILEDERVFRRLEHLKHMEYFEIGIMALKAHLLRQTQPTTTLNNKK